jgi:hypothetical protein
MPKYNTRTSKKQSTKLKWWYVLPVILIMAIAGYFIVRLSFASDKKILYELGCRTNFSMNNQDRWAFAFRGKRTANDISSIYLTSKKDGTGAKIREYNFDYGDNFKIAVDVSEANLNKEIYVYTKGTKGIESIGSILPNSLSECD